MIYVCPVIENSCLHLRLNAELVSVRDGRLVEGILERGGWEAAEGPSVANITLGEGEREKV